MKVTYALLAVLLVSGCKYYGSALPPDYPMSMDNALTVARDRSLGAGGQERNVVKKVMRPRIERPSYVPEKELAVVASPKTLLVWTYPHVTDDNTRVFGNWSTIFITDRYEWIKPVNEIAEEDMVTVPRSSYAPVQR
jgi:hypothetical protein